MLAAASAAAARRWRSNALLLPLPASLLPSRRLSTSSDERDPSNASNNANDESAGGPEQPLDFSRGYLREWREQQERRERTWTEVQVGRTEHRQWVDSEWDRMRARWANGRGLALFLHVYILQSG
jgi:hypothetical protein